MLIMILRAFIYILALLVSALYLTSINKVVLLKVRIVGACIIVEGWRPKFSVEVKIFASYNLNHIPIRAKECDTQRSLAWQEVNCC
jgi:hypothetical protein